MAVPEGVLTWACVAAGAVVAPAGLGAGLVRLLGVPAAAGARTVWGLGYVVGQLATAALTALWLAAGQPLPGAVVPVLAAVLGALAWRHARARDAAAGRTATTSGPRSRLVAFATLLAVVFAGHAAMVWNATPVRYGDEAEIWASKAKVLHAAPVVDTALGLTMVAHADYPNLQPLVQVLAFASVGRVLHAENRLPVQCFALALLLLLSAAAERRTRPVLAAAAVLACAATFGTGHAALVYADVPLACATLAAAVAWLRWRETGEQAWWRVACLALAAMLAIKNEGAMLAVVLALAAAVGWWLRRDERGARTVLPLRELGWLLVPAAAVALHLAFLHAYELRNDLLDPRLTGGRGLFGRVLAQAGSHGPQVLSFFGAMLVEPVHHRLLPLLCVGGAIAAWLRGGAGWLRSDAAVLAAVVAGSIAGYALVFVGTYADLTWHLATAATRTTAHVVPLAALGCCALLPAGGTARA